MSADAGMGTRGGFGKTIGIPPGNMAPTEWRWGRSRAAERRVDGLYARSYSHLAPRRLRTRGTQTPLPHTFPLTLDGEFPILSCNMGYREQLERKIESKRKEISALRNDLQQAETYVAAWEEALKMLPREVPGAPLQAGASQLPPLRPGTAIAHAREAIITKNMPMHIADLVLAIGKENTKPNRLALAGTLASYSKEGRLFVRTDPNTFGLLELGHRPMVTLGSGGDREEDGNA